MVDPPDRTMLYNGTKCYEHKGTKALMTHLVKSTPNINGAILNHSVNCFRYRSGEVRVRKLKKAEE
jgi:hypothetical protein